ncbi:unnamed protein product [Oikopleura dioica]|uniref:Protein disulfide-isomerase A3 n=1 Tax=Oikopleura dioica TaxID=34765 RepID=E4WWP9_OIKDI|nr:unnamed protein product [Oikopleura dioica]
MRISALTILPFALSQKHSLLNDIAYKWVQENESKAVIFFERDQDCFHCESAFKEIRNVAERVDFEKVAFHRVSCDDQPEICKDEAIRRFPTVRYYEDGEHLRDYTKPIVEDALANWLVKIVDFIPLPIKSERDLNDLKEISKLPLAIAFFDDTQKDEMQAFTRVGNRFSNAFEFVNADFVSEEFLGYYGKVLVIKSDEKIVYDGEDFEQNHMKRWFEDISLNSGCPTVSPNTLHQAYKKPLIIALISRERFRVEKKYWCNRIQSITGNFPIYKFAIADVMDFAGRPGMRNGELGGSSWDTSKPHLVIMDEKEQIYPMRQEYDNFKIRRFLTYYEDGKLEPFLSHSEL